MARLCKKSLVYFPLDVEFFSDRKIRRLNIRTNYVGSTIYLFMLTMIYRDSYYIKTSITDLIENIVSSFPNNNVYSLKQVEEIINLCLDLGLFDKALAKNGVFTSKGIQRQYLLSTRRRKDVDIKNYWFLTEEDMIEINIKLKSSCEHNDEIDETEEDNCIHNANNNGINVDNNLVELDHCSPDVDQSKSKRKSNSKKNSDKREKNDKFDKTKLYSLPKTHYLTQVLIHNKYIDEWSLDIPKYNSLFEDLCNNYEFKDVCIATNYLLNYSKHADPPIDFPFAFFSSSIIRSLKNWHEELKHQDEAFEIWIERFLRGASK